MKDRQARVLLFSCEDVGLLARSSTRRAGPDYSLVRRLRYLPLIRSYSSLRIASMSEELPGDEFAFI